MDRLQKLGRELGYEGKELQDFVAQENKRERDERPAEREIEKAKIASEEAKLAQQREIELANVKAEEAKLAQQREIELANVKAEEAKIAQQREIELAKVASEEAKEKAKIAQQREIELAKVEAAKIAKENEFELARLTAEEANKLRDIELAKLAVEEARVLRDNEIELAKLTQQEELARSKSEHEKDKEIELARLHLEHEKLKMEQEIEHEKLKMEQEVELTRIDSQERQAKLDSDAKFAGQLELGKLGVEKAAHARNPKLPYFEESKDKMDSYLSRFEKYAVTNKWDRSIWAAYLSALLKGRALEVYDRLSVADANDYEKLKDALLKNFDMTERGFRKKFRNDRPERAETFIQFGSRLRSYLDKWINMANENTFEAICDFMARDQFLESCSRELYVHLKPKTFKNLDEMAKEADLFAEARGGVHTCTNKGQRDNRGAAWNHSKPDVNKGGGKQEIKCGICGKGHLTIKCYKNPNRMQANRAEVGNEAKGGDSDAKNEMQGAQARSDSFQNKGRGNSFGRGRNFPRGRGRGGNPPRGGGHQVNFCKTQIEERSENGIENIYQSKGDNSINSVTKDKEGVCYFLKSRLPTARGTVNGKGVIAMRDTGCTGCVIRSSLVSEDQLLGKASDVTLINETTQRYPLALIDIDCPFFSGQTEALCMDNTLYDVVIGNIDGSKLPDMSHFCAAVETRSQAKQCEKKYRKLKVPDQIINEDKEALKKAQAIDGNLANIRSRVKSGKVTVSRGLNRGQTKFVERKDLLYREFTKGNKVTLQLVVPEGFREKVMRLAHETLMSGHLGTKKTLDRVVAEFFWPGICGDVARFCKSCDICQRTIQKGRVSKVPLGKLPLIDTPFKRVAVDIVGPIEPRSEKRNRYILTMIDYATRYPEAVALTSIETERVAEV